MQLKNSIENYAELRARSDAAQVRMAFHGWFSSDFGNKNGGTMGMWEGISWAIANMNSPAVMKMGVSENGRVMPQMMIR